MRRRILLCSAAFTAAAFGCTIFQRAKSDAAFSKFEEAIAQGKYDVADAMIAGPWDVHLAKWSKSTEETRINFERQEQSFMDWLVGRHRGEINVGRVYDRYAIGNTIGVATTSSGVEVVSHVEGRNDIPTTGETIAAWVGDAGVTIMGLTKLALSGQP